VGFWQKILREFGRKFCAISPQNFAKIGQKNIRFCGDMVQNFAGIWHKIVRFQNNSRSKKFCQTNVFFYLSADDYIHLWQMIYDLCRFISMLETTDG
jgi:hypothetical protein